MFCIMFICVEYMKYDIRHYLMMFTSYSISNAILEEIEYGDEHVNVIGNSFEHPHISY